MATFRLPPPDVGYDDHKEELKERISADFTINAFKNAATNFKRKLLSCTQNQSITISPSSDPHVNVIILPPSSACPEDIDSDGTFDTIICYSPKLLIGPNRTYGPGCGGPLSPEQPPFALLSKGILFRNRNVPYLVSAGGTKTFMDEVIS